MLIKSTSAGKVKVQAKVEGRMKNVRSSLNLDLSLVHSLQTIEFPPCHNSFSADS